MFRVNNRNTRKRCEICAKLTIKTAFPSVSIVDFEQVNVSWVMIFLYQTIWNLGRLNDTHREKLCFIQISTRMAGWLLLTFLICLHNELSSIIHFINTY